MSANEQPHHRRIRRTKRFLRFMPRRALLHKYPVVGRFAAFARRRAYLWSFRTVNLRPAFYAGSILSLLPVMGVQLPIALALSLALRANFMVMGGLQFITNPFTAAPIYYGTHQVGKAIITSVGFNVDPAQVESAVSEALAPAEDASPVARPRRLRDAPWFRRVGSAISSLIVGGVACGLVLGLILDGLHRYSARVMREHHRPPPRPPPAHPRHTGKTPAPPASTVPRAPSPSGSTGTIPPPS